jgi:hypothetical protein
LSSIYGKLDRVPDLHFQAKNFQMKTLLKMNAFSFFFPAEGAIFIFTFLEFPIIETKMYLFIFNWKVQSVEIRQFFKVQSHMFPSFAVHETASRAKFFLGISVILLCRSDIWNQQNLSYRAVSQFWNLLNQYLHYGNRNLLSQLYCINFVLEFCSAWQNFLFKVNIFLIKILKW